MSTDQNTAKITFDGCLGDYHYHEQELKRQLGKDSDAIIVRESASLADAWTDFNRDWEKSKYSLDSFVARSSRLRGGSVSYQDDPVQGKLLDALSCLHHAGLRLHEDNLSSQIKDTADSLKGEIAIFEALGLRHPVSALSDAAVIYKQFGNIRSYVQTSSKMATAFTGPKGHLRSCNFGGMTAGTLEGEEAVSELCSMRDELLPLLRPMKGWLLEWTEDDDGCKFEAGRMYDSLKKQGEDVSRLCKLVEELNNARTIRKS